MTVVLTDTAPTVGAVTVSRDPSGDYRVQLHLATGERLERWVTQWTRVEEVLAEFGFPG